MHPVQHFSTEELFSIVSPSVTSIAEQPPHLLLTISSFLRSLVEFSSFTAGVGPFLSSGFWVFPAFPSDGKGEDERSA